MHYTKRVRWITTRVFLTSRPVGYSIFKNLKDLGNELDTSKDDFAKEL
jgi:hypothetical protein